MATDPAAPTKPTHYWQLPTFALGVAAALGSWQYAPAKNTDPAAVYKAALTGLRGAVDKKPADPGQVEPLARQVVAVLDRYPEQAAVGHYLAGSGFLILADSDSAEAAAYARMAAQHLTAADGSWLSKDDAARLPFRRAVAQAMSNAGDPQQILAALAVVPEGEDRVETARLVSHTYLRLTPPDLEKAAGELAKYLGMPHRLTPAKAAEYRYALADLRLQLNDPAGARKWLTDFDSAPPAIAAKATLLKGRLAAAADDWAEASKLFEKALTLPGLPAADKVWLNYDAGLAAAKVGSPSAAVPFLETAARDAGPIGFAANVRLAELATRDAANKGNRGAAVAHLEKAFALKATGTEAVIPARDVKAAVEDVLRRSQSEGDFASAVRAAACFVTVTDAAAASEKKADALAAWATSLGADPAANAKRVEAAAAYTAAADGAETMPTTARAYLYRRAVDSARQANAAEAGRAAVEKLLALKDAPAEDVAAAWLAKAELLPATDAAGVNEALQKAMAAPGPAAAGARLKLAKANLARGRQLLADATTPAAKAEAAKVAAFGQQLLEQLADASTVSAAETATHEEAVFELGRRKMAAGQFADAEARFRKLLQLYPDGPWSGYARLWLGCCLLASAPADQPDAPKLGEAVEVLKVLSVSKDPFLRTQAGIRTMNALIVQQKFDEAAKYGDGLAATHRGTADELTVAKLQYYAAVKRPEPDLSGGLKAVLRMEELLKMLPAKEYSGDPEYSREKWSKEVPALRAELEKKRG